MEPANSAELEVLREHSAGLQPGARRCRSRGHAMDEHFSGYTQGREAYISIERCLRCGTMVTQIVDFEGIVLNTVYEYPDGYRLPKGTGRLGTTGRGVYRSTVIQEQIDRQNRKAGRQLKAVRKVA